MPHVICTIGHASPEIVRREQSVRSRQHHGVLTRVLYESESLEVLHTEMEPGTASDCPDCRDFAAVHHVIEGTPLFRLAETTADLMPGDSILLPEESVYTISNCAPARSVILSVLFTPRGPKAPERHRPRDPSDPPCRLPDRTEPGI